MFDFLQFLASFLIGGCNLKRFLKACAGLRVVLLHFEDEPQVQIRFVNAAFGTASGFSVDGFGLLEATGIREQRTKENVPSRISWVACKSLPIPSLGTTKFTLLAIKVTQMPLNEMTLFGRAESKGSSQS